MLVRKVGFLLYVLLQTGFCQSPARLLVQGVGTVEPAFGHSFPGSDFAPSASELALLEQQTITATDHGTSVTFQGVLLTDLLVKVDLPTGEKFRQTAASYYLVAESRTGYRAVFAWTEVDPSFTDKAMYVVTKRNGRPLSEDDGPFELIVPGERSNARWVRQLSLLRVEPNTTPFDSEQARWIRGNLPELESVTAGMTRKDLLKVFMNEGGLSPDVAAIRLQEMRIRQGRCGVRPCWHNQDSTTPRVRGPDAMGRGSERFLGKPG